MAQVVGNFLTGIVPMPVTAKLSKLFYDRFGEQVTDELVNWFNQVDAAYRTELRELNELNFARFDAKLEQRLVERVTELEVTLTERIAALEVRLDGKIEALDAKFERRFGEQTRWMLGMWITIVLAAVALWFRH